MKRLAISIACGIALMATSAATAIASPPSITGTWSVQQTGLNGTSTSTITLTQSGNGIVGSNASNGNGFTGTFVNRHADQRQVARARRRRLADCLRQPKRAQLQRHVGLQRASRKRVVRRQQGAAAVADHRGRNVARDRCGRPGRFHRIDALHAIRVHRSSATPGPS